MGSAVTGGVQQLWQQFYTEILSPFLIS